MKRRYASILAFSLLALALLWGCGAGSGSHNASSGSQNTGNSGNQSTGAQSSSTNANAGALVFTVQWPTSTQTASATQSVLIVLSANGQTVTQQLVTRPAGAASSTVTFNNLPVEPIIATATSYTHADGSGAAVAGATVLVTVVSNTVVGTAFSFTPIISSVSISPTPITLKVGATMTLVGTAFDANGAVVLTGGSDWAWTSGQTGIATVGPTGSSPTLRGVSAGQANITVVEKSSGNSATAVANVGNLSISISPVQVTLSPGSVQQFTANSTPFPASPVTWQVQEGSAGGAVDQNGLYAAPTTSGTYHVVVTLQQYPTYTATATVTVATAPSGSGYTITDLGAVTALGMNASGQTTGYSLDPQSGVASVFRGASNGNIVNLGNDPAGISLGIGINANGQIAGYTSVSSGYITIYSFRTTATGSVTDGTATDFGSQAGTSTVEATGINDAGQITGYHGQQSSAGTFLTAFRTSVNGAANLTVTDLGALDVNGVSRGFAINATGQVTGDSAPPNGNPRAFRTTANGTLTDGSATDLGVLPGTLQSTGTAINSSGQVAGTAIDANGGAHAFRTTATGTLADGTALDLGSLGGGASRAYGIDSHGNVVGESQVPGGGTHAFLYTDHMVDLNTLIPANSGIVLTRAVAINANGQILANYTGTKAGTHSALLIPVGSKSASKRLPLGQRFQSFAPSSR